jgi:hypothetical protein
MLLPQVDNSVSPFIERIQNFRALTASLFCFNIPIVDLTLQLFRACCQDAYYQRGTWGVLCLWLPLFGDVVAQMLAEYLSELQRTSELQVSVETVSPSAKDRTHAMNSVWQRINHQWIIPPLSALTRFRRKLTRPLTRELNRPRLKHPANMHFERHLHHWITMGARPQYESGVDTRALQGTASAFLRSNAGGPAAFATLRQTIRPDDYRGKLLRFSGDVKVEQVEQQAGLYIRANRQDERLRPENALQGTRDWRRYEAIVSVAEDAPFIRFGVVLFGTGQIWLANARLEVIEQNGTLYAAPT